jgi:hypothetical protein
VITAAESPPDSAISPTIRALERQMETNLALLIVTASPPASPDRRPSQHLRSGQSRRSEALRTSRQRTRSVPSWVEVALSTVTDDVSPASVVTHVS